MKLLTVLLLVGAYIIGAKEQDVTYAVILTMLSVPILLDGKKVKKCPWKQFRKLRWLRRK